ncbi:MAG: hypothetical protein KatS3mg035_0491 [Bacteroidia bacterium]|nr:MAG: hypothetical protein KatS3mg035_0491 [Bacteroidia bacterium]
MKYIKIFFFLLFISFYSFSQKITITGKVIDSQTGEELPGAKDHGK